MLKIFRRNLYVNLYLILDMAKKLFNGKFSFWISATHNKVHAQKVATKPVTFHKSMRVTLLIGQLFSLMPVDGVFSDSATNVKFVWKSWQCVYSLICLIGQIFMTIMCLNQIHREESILSAILTLIYYGTTCATMLMFFQIARKWPLLVQHISKTEELDPDFDSKLSLKCNVTCAIILFLALVEHLLSLASAISGVRAMLFYPDHITYEGFTRRLYPSIFDELPYSPLLGGVTQFLHIQATFIWNYSNVFVICMSYYLTSRLQQVNKKLLVAQGKYLPETFWRSMREAYGRATQIVRKVDDVISGIVFVSFSNNLFFICWQLYNTLQPPKMGGYEATLYFVFSLVYLLSRSVAVSLIASEVKVASDIPAQVLYDVPSPVYCTEVQRFLDQVNGDVIALSGLQFFYITRGLLLTVAGTIITYELVMFQVKAPTSLSISTFSDINTTVATI